MNKDLTEKVAVDFYLKDCSIFNFEFEEFEKGSDLSEERFNHNGIVFVQQKVIGDDYTLGLEVFTNGKIKDLLREALNFKFEESKAYLEETILFSTKCEIFIDEKYKNYQDENIKNIIKAVERQNDLEKKMYFDNLALCRIKKVNKSIDKVFAINNYGALCKSYDLAVFEKMLKYKQNTEAYEKEIEWVYPKQYFINEKGEEFSCICDNIYRFDKNGLAKIELAGKYGFINTKGEEITPCKYDLNSIFPFEFEENGFALVKLNGKYGFINEKGEEVVPCKYDFITKFYNNGLAQVKLNGKCGLINEKGKEVIPCKYDDIGGFYESDLSRVELAGKYGFINEKGKEVIPCKYEDTDFFSNGFAVVGLNGKYGFINEKGEEVIPCKYDYIKGFYESDLSKVEIAGKYGFINTKGEEVIPCKYKDVDNFSNGFAVVEK